MRRRNRRGRWTLRWDRSHSAATYLQQQQQRAGPGKLFVAAFGATVVEQFGRAVVEQFRGVFVGQLAGVVVEQFVGLRTAEGGAGKSRDVGRAQVEVAVLQPQVLVHARVIQRERRHVGLVQHLQLARDDLHRPRRQPGILRTRQPRRHHPRELDHILTPQPVTRLRHLRMLLRAKNHLRQTLPVAQIDEDHPAMIPPRIHPPRERDGLADVGRAELLAMMRAVHRKGARNVAGIPAKGRTISRRSIALLPPPPTPCYGPHAPPMPPRPQTTAKKSSRKPGQTCWNLRKQTGGLGNHPGTRRHQTGHPRHQTGSVAKRPGTLENHPKIPPNHPGLGKSRPGTPESHGQILGNQIKESKKDTGILQ